MFLKDTNSFTYVLPRIYFPKNNIESNPKVVALRLRRISDWDENLKNVVQNIKTI